MKLGSINHCSSFLTSFRATCLFLPRNSDISSTFLLLFMFEALSSQTSLSTSIFSSWNIWVSSTKENMWSSLTGTLSATFFIRCLGLTSCLGILGSQFGIYVCEPDKDDVPFVANQMSSSLRTSPLDGASRSTPNLPLRNATMWSNKILEFQKLVQYRILLERHSQLQRGRILLQLDQGAHPKLRWRCLLGQLRPHLWQKG